MNRITKTFFLLLASSAIIFGCKDEISDGKSESTGSEVVQTFTYEFNLSDAPITKVQTDNESITLDEGDEVRVLALSGRSSRFGISYVNNASVTFGFEATSGLAKDDKVFAYYPVLTPDNKEPKRIDMSIPSEQIQEDGLYDVEAIPMVSEALVLEKAPANGSKVGTLQMKPLASFLEVKVFSTYPQFVGQKIKSIEFKGNRVSGDFTWDFTLEESPETLGCVKSSVETKLAEEEQLSVPATEAEAVSLFLVLSPGTRTGEIVINTEENAYTYQIEEKNYQMGAETTLVLDLDEAECDVLKTYPYTYEFGLLDAPITKVQAENGSITLSEGDEVRILAMSGNSSRFGTSPVSNASITFGFEATSGLVENDKICAYYPILSQENDNEDPKSIAMKIPSKQTQEGAQYDAGAIPLVSETLVLESAPDNGSKVGALQMRALASFLEVKVFSTFQQFVGQKIISIEFKGSKVSGDFTWDFTAEEFPETLGCELTSVTTELSENEQFSVPATEEDAVSLFLVLAPGTRTGEIVIKTEENAYTYQIEDKSYLMGAETSLVLDLDQAVSEDLKAYSYKFGLSDAPITKVQTDNESITLDEGDEVGLLALSGNSSRFGTSPVSNASITFGFEATSGLVKDDEIFAYYPILDPDDEDPQSLGMTIPTKQTQEDGQYDAEAIPLVSEGFVLESNPANDSKLGTLQMQTLASFLEVKVFSTYPQFVGQEIKSIEFKGSKVSGDFTWDFTSEEFPETLGCELTSVTTELSENEQLSVPATEVEAVSLFLVLAPGTRTGEIVIKTEENRYTYQIGEKNYQMGAETTLVLDLDQAESDALRTYTYKFGFAVEEGCALELPAEVGVFFGEENEQVTLDNGEYTLVTEDKLQPDTKVAAYAPYSASNALPSQFVFNIPEEQANPIDGAYPTSAMTLVATPVTITAETSLDGSQQAGSFEFHNLTSKAEFQVFSSYSSYSDEKVKSVEFVANGIAGNYTWDLTASAPTWAPAATGKSVKVTAENLAIGANAEAAAVLNAVVAPGTFSGNLIVTTTQAEYTIACENLEFARNTETVVTADLSTAASVKLLADLDLAGVELPTVDELNITLDGNGKSIKNWTSTTALFAKVAKGAEVKNLTIDESCVLTIGNVGDLGFVTSANEGTLTSIVNNADITLTALPTGGDSKFGAICGVNKGTMTSCENNGDITYSGAPPSSKNLYLAGVAGQTTDATGTMNQCKNTGAITVTLNAVPTTSVYVSGVAGTLNNNSKVLNSVNDGNITVKAPGSKEMVAVAGISQYAGGEISGCTNNGNITYYAESADGAADGGVQRTGVAGIAAYIGWSGNTVKNNTNNGDITFRGGYSLGYAACGSASKYAINVAGVFGHVFKCITENCNNAGKVTSLCCDIDNDAATAYSGNPVRQSSCGGIVASSWGAINNCTNDGDIEFVFTTSKPVAGVARSGYNGKAVGYMVGGISGGDYHSDQLSSPITSSTNNGDINVVADAAAYNNNAGGIVGWPHKENNGAKTLSECENTGDITFDGYSLGRIGGISGGAIKLNKNVNRGKIYFKGGATGSKVGGVSGLLAGANTIIECENYGEIVSDVKLTGGVGGIAGGSNNQATATINGCKVDCAITVPEGTGRTYMIIGHVDSNKYQSGTTPAITKNVYGTEESPNIVAGGSITVGSTKTEITADNYAVWSLPWDVSKAPAESGLINTTGISYVVKFQTAE